MRITIIDLVERGPTRDPFKRRMSANYATIMPQAVAVWCDDLGHEVRYVCYTGGEDLAALADDTDLLILGAFTVSAYLAYALSRIYRDKGAITALGGPHARCYPEDAERHFDYVLGLTTQAEIEALLGEAMPHRPRGRHLAAGMQPAQLPSLRRRWKFAEANFAKTGSMITLVPMIGSLGCPYTCSFCIDAAIKYQPLDLEQLTDDIKFVRTQVKNPILGWHDPNFGVRFDEFMTAIERAAPPGSVRSVAEMSLSLLTDANLKRLERNGFVGILPGIESWNAYGNKSNSTRATGEEKVEQIAAQINRMLAHIPFVQTNFILGLDCDSGAEPFALTKRFMDLTPGAYHAFSLFTAYGRASPLNLDLQRAGRVNAMAFQFLDSNHGMNVKPLHYDWPEFYDQVADVTRHALGARGIWRRLKSNGVSVAGLFNLFRGVTTGRPKYQAAMARMLREDRPMRAYYEGETNTLPPFLEARLRGELGAYWEALPPSALAHEPNAYVLGDEMAAA